MPPLRGHEEGKQSSTIVLMDVDAFFQQKEYCLVVALLESFEKGSEPLLSLSLLVLVPLKSSACES